MTNTESEFIDSAVEFTKQFPQTVDPVGFLTRMYSYIGTLRPNESYQEFSAAYHLIIIVQLLNERLKEVGHAVVS